MCAEIEVAAFDFYQGGRTEAFSQRTDAKACWALDKAPELLTHLFEDSRSENPALRQIEAYAQRYHFFHFEVAFPEAFAGEKKGFDIILGNPQWDKTRLFDTDFFPQYHSNYRSLKNSEKAAVQKRLLEGEHIATAYQTAQRSMEVANEYYKDKATFPLNKGAGDANLFRLFVERNLELLASGGSLSYVLPSALMFEACLSGSRPKSLHVMSSNLPKTPPMVSLGVNRIDMVY